MQAFAKVGSSVPNAVSDPEVFLELTGGFCLVLSQLSVSSDERDEVSTPPPERGSVLACTAERIILCGDQTGKGRWRCFVRRLRRHRNV